MSGGFTRRTTLTGEDVDVIISHRNSSLSDAAAAADCDDGRSMSYKLSDQHDALCIYYMSASSASRSVSALVRLSPAREHVLVKKRCPLLMYSLRNTSLYTQDAPPPLPQLLRIQVPVGTMGSLSAPWPKCHAPTARFTEQLGCILYRGLKVKVKEADLYTAFIEIPTLKALRYGSHSVTCKLHRTCLYLVSIYQMSHPRLRLRTSNCSLLLIYLPERMKG